MFEQIFNFLGYNYKISNKLDKKLIKNASLIIYYSKKELLINKPLIQIIPGKLFSLTENQFIVHKSKTFTLINKDIILKSFKIISREEEYESNKVDKHKNNLSQIKISFPEY